MTMCVILGQISMLPDLVAGHEVSFLDRQKE